MTQTSLYNSYNPENTRWEKLYSLNKPKIEKKIINERQGAIVKECEELKACTFNPIINKKLQLNLKKE